MLPMLPRSVYKMLPYLYIAIGLLCAWAIDSDIVFIPSVLLMSAGLIILWMRRKPGQARATLVNKGSVVCTYQLREGDRRLPEEDQEFPITDDNHNMVPFDRRVGERRKKKE